MTIIPDKLLTALIDELLYCEEKFPSLVSLIDADVFVIVELKGVMRRAFVGLLRPRGFTYDPTHEIAFKQFEKTEELIRMQNSARHNKDLVPLFMCLATLTHRKEDAERLLEWGGMKRAEIKVNDFGGSPFAEHNMPCPTCRDNHAMLSMNSGVFGPCIECERLGWMTVRIPKTWFGKILHWLIGLGRV